MITQFLSLPSASPTKADVWILPVPYEQTVTFKTGTAAGPSAIMAVSDQLEFYEEDMGWCPTEYMQLCVLDAMSPRAGEDAADFHARLVRSARALKGDNLLVALGGEHSITPSLVFGRMPVGGTVVQIDAHADLRPSYQGSVFNHACPMHRLRECGYALLQIGIRSLHAREAAMVAADNDINLYSDRELRNPDRWNELLRHLSTLQGPIWLTIDMDGFDPALVSGVGTPQPGGLGWHQGLDILQALFSNSSIDLRGMDIVELVPEPSRVSEMVAAKLVQKSISYWGKAKGFDRRPANGSQVGVEDE